MDRIHHFARLQERYDSIFKEDLKEGQLPMRSTNYGFWGTSSLFSLFQFFQDVGLEQYSHFLDLGSGDGRAVLVASLFTRATGIEGDEDLVNQSLEIRDEMSMDADFLCDDFMKHDFSDYDFIFIYPDKAFSDDFQEKIKTEAKGDFFVYNNIYLPRKLEKGKTFWVEQMPIIRYK